MIVGSLPKSMTLLFVDQKGSDPREYGGNIGLVQCQRELHWIIGKNEPTGA